MPVKQTRITLGRADVSMSFDVQDGPIRGENGPISVACGACAALVIDRIWPGNLNYPPPIAIRCWSCGMWGVFEDDLRVPGDPQPPQY